MRAVGYESTIVATDLGQPENPTPVDGMRTYVEAMLRHGFSDAHLFGMTRDAPPRAIGLE